MSATAANWKTIVDEHNKRAFAWPPGWSTKEDIAIQLGCTPDRVRDVLAPALRAGVVEAKMHRVWTDGRMSRVIGYRQVAKPGK